MHENVNKLKGLTIGLYLSCLSPVNMLCALNKEYDFSETLIPQCMTTYCCLWQTLVQNTKNSAHAVLTLKSGSLGLNKEK